MVPANAQKVHQAIFNKGQVAGFITEVIALHNNGQSFVGVVPSVQVNGSTYVLRMRPPIVVGSQPNMIVLDLADIQTVQISYADGSEDIV
jgi:hypothetical protein